MKAMLFGLACYVNAFLCFASVGGNTQWNFYIGVAEVSAGTVAKVAGEVLKSSGGWWSAIGYGLSVAGDLLISDGITRLQQSGQ
jgi:hypothetical protein